MNERKKKANNYNTETKVKNKIHVAIKKYWREILKKNVAFKII